MLGRIHTPYVKNTVTYNCQLYPSKHAANPLTSSSLSGSFDVSLVVFLISLLSAFGIAYLALHRKFRK